MFQPLPLCSDRLQLAHEYRFVRRAVQSGNIHQQRRTEFDPGPVLCPDQWIIRMKITRRNIIEIFADHGGLKQRFVFIHQQNRHFAQGRQAQKPVRLVGQIDVVAQVGNSFLQQHND